MGVESVRGESSHQEHPFMALAAGNADQSQGEVYGMHFVYSGNFIGQVELGQFDTVRVGMGIHPENFCWKLEKVRVSRHRKLCWFTVTPDMTA